MPKFRDLATWQQAEQLMQPVFIRLIANVGKQLEQSVWRGSYEDMLVWEAGVSDVLKARVLQLRSQLAADPPPEQAAELEQELAALPAPYPGYLLRLSHQGQEVTVELWDLCYQICFRNYDSATGTSWTQGFGQSKNEGVEVDTSLFEDTGELDWNRIDEKTKRVVDRIFANLPSA